MEILAEPNTQLVVKPQIELYFFNTTGTPGTLIDFDDLSAKSAQINFGGHTAGASLCTVIHTTDEDGKASWVTAYDNTPPDDE